MVQSRTVWCALPKIASNTSNSIAGDHYGLFRKARSNFEQWMLIVVSHPSGSISHQRCARFSTPRPMSAAPFRDSRRQRLLDTTTGKVIGKLRGKDDVLTSRLTG